MENPLHDFKEAEKRNIKEDDLDKVEKALRARKARRGKGRLKKQEPRREFDESSHYRSWTCED